MYAYSISRCTAAGCQHCRCCVQMGYKAAGSNFFQDPTFQSTSPHFSFFACSDHDTDLCFLFQSPVRDASHGVDPNSSAFAPPDQSHFSIQPHHSTLAPVGEAEEEQRRPDLLIIMGAMWIGVSSQRRRKEENGLSLRGSG